MAKAERPKVRILALPATSAAVLYGLYEVLSWVGRAWEQLTLGQPDEPLLDVKIVAATKQPFRIFHNVPVAPELDLSEAEDADVVCVTDVMTPLDAPPQTRYPVETEWLKRTYARGAILSSVCSGTLFLAESGLLDGQDATTHWALRDKFRIHYPKVRLHPERILAVAGEGHRIITAGGQAAWEDLSLYLISRLCGQEEAVRTAKIYSLSPRHEGQLQFTAMPQRPQDADSVIRACQFWVADNYRTGHPVAGMLAQSGLSARTFARRFRSATGYTPMDYVQALRIEEAKQLLERGEGQVDDIATEIGYSDPTSFRRLFKRFTGLSPAAYRRRFDLGRL
ncbi:MAG TPA: helix-turn-helix domain-containing protein [Bradyrhizobium sp.]|nr:helix-turn-helix domain-containing protein [Bradyrhizobium sp.]